MGSLKVNLVILVFVLVQFMAWYTVLSKKRNTDWGEDTSSILKELPSIIREVNYFQMNGKGKLVSLNARSMKSLGENVVHLNQPSGHYFFQDQRGSLQYFGEKASYFKKAGILHLINDVTFKNKDTEFSAEEIIYFINQEKITGKKDVEVKGKVESTNDHFILNGDEMVAYPQEEKIKLFSESGVVTGKLLPFKSFATPMDFQGKTLNYDGTIEKVELRENVSLKRSSIDVSAQNGDIFLERANKKLKYFVLNDDVKVIEKLVNGQGQTIERKAFSERLEGTGTDMLVLTGAPRVIQGKDEIKGYKITLREKMELIEVDDALSEVEVKKKREK